MEIMKATTARIMTVKTIETKRAHLLETMNSRILATISAGQFECNFRVDSPVLQDELFDHFTSLGYAVKFMPNEKNGKKYYDPDSRIMNISWEDAIV